MSSFFNLPTNLCVKFCVSKGEYAVWSVDEIPFGTRFGPYEVKGVETSGNQSERFYWQVNRLVKEDLDERMSNWLWFVNYTCNKEQQNMIAIRHRSAVYYITSKCIPANTELLVFCANKATKHINQSKGICNRNDHHKAENIEGERKEKFGCAREKNEVPKIEAFHPDLNDIDQSNTNYSSLIVCNENRTPVTIRENIPTCKEQSAVNDEGAPHISGINGGIEKTHHSDTHSKVFTAACTELKYEVIPIQKNLKRKNTERKLKSIDRFEIGEIRCNTNSYGQDVSNSNNKGDVENVEVNTHQEKHNSEETYEHRKHEKRLSENVVLKQYERIHGSVCTEKISHSSSAVYERLYQCNICLKQCSSKNALSVHKRIHTGEKPYECKICQKKFAYNHALRDHIKIHTGKNLYECDLCEKKFANCSNFYRHRKIHSGVKLFECKICQKRFHNSSELITHGRTHTGEKPYECSACQKRFSRSRDLIIHKRIHTGDSPFQCNICQKSCSTKRSLMLHSRVHTGEKPYECEVCQTKFAYSQSFKAHMKIHTGETPYVCNFCEKKFSSNNVLKTHERIHTGEKPYECNICQRRFAYSGVLKGHIRTHTGEYPFNCKFCEKKFVNSSNLSRHIKIHTGKRPYVCSVCEKRFICKRYLVAHTKNHFCEKPRIYNLAYVSLIMKQIYPEPPLNYM